MPICLKECIVQVCYIQLYPSVVLIYNVLEAMKARRLHDWNLRIDQAKELQRHLASQISPIVSVDTLKFVGGVDISAPDSNGVARGAAVVLSYPDLQLAETSIVEDTVHFPYVPGLLSFRESPLVIKALEGLNIEPDIILIDGQGIAHPRRFGIACHVGLLVDVPTIGCAKSRLWGTHSTPSEERGAYAELYDNDGVIGIVLRTKPRTNPIYVSIGHKMDLTTAVQWTFNCCRGYRIPEPTRYAHLAAGGKIKTSAAGESMARQLSLPE